MARNMCARPDKRFINLIEMTTTTMFDTLCWQEKVLLDFIFSYLKSIYQSRFYSSDCNADWSEHTLIFSAKVNVQQKKLHFFSITIKFVGKKD